MSTQNVGHPVPTPVPVPVPVSDVCVGTLSPLSLGLASLGVVLSGDMSHEYLACRADPEVRRAVSLRISCLPL